MKEMNMETKQLKKEFHRLIDDFSDDNLLKQFFELISECQNRNENVDIFDQLTKEQKIRLKTSLKQAKTGNTISNGKVKGKARDWLAR